jgi:ABC-type sugar transport system substrate-binding protein
MAGCDSDGPLAAPARQAISARVLLLPPFEQSPEWRDVGRGISQYFEHLEGFQLEILAPPSRPKNYPTAIQHALESKPDVVVLPMHDTETMRPFASLVAQSGATLITYGDPADVRGVFGHVEVNWLVGIGELASRLPEIAAPSHSYVLIHNNGGSAAGAARYERFTTQAARQFAVTRLDECDLFEAKLDPGTAIRRMLARFRSTGIVVSLDSGFWGRMTDETINELPCRFVATGAPPEVWRWLENGKAAALVGVNSAELGRELGRLIIQATEGGTGSDSSRVVSAQVITRDNLADFRRRYADALGQKNADFKPAPAANQHAP